MKDIEIEITYQVEESFWNDFMARIKSDGVFIKHESQLDEYYTPAHRDFTAPANKIEWLSIRNRGGRAKINYKKWHDDPNAIGCTELETAVADIDVMKNIFAALDFLPVVTVHKERDIFMTADNKIEIAMDWCENLGWFIEAEIKGDFESEEVAEEFLRNWVKDNGLDKFPEDHKGYAWVLMEKYCSEKLNK